MGITKSKKINIKLEEFTNKLKSKVVHTNVIVSIEEKTSINSCLTVSVHVENSDFNFEVTADGVDIDMIINELGQDVEVELNKRKALIYMLESGLDSQSPYYSIYLH